MCRKECHVYKYAIIIALFSYVMQTYFFSFAFEVKYDMDMFIFIKHKPQTNTHLTVIKFGLGF